MPNFSTLQLLKPQRTVTASRVRLRVWCDHCNAMVKANQDGDPAPHNCKLYEDRADIPDLDFDV